jgi:5-methyltetrahydrofolate--homocysteine methyltransferase
MTDTVISSATKDVVIGFDKPFVMIGERINPTGRKQLAAELMAGNFDRVVSDTQEQVAAGAHMLDVNAGVTDGDEAALMVKLVKLVQSLTDVPLCLDSSFVSALEAGLSVYQGKALVNSVTAEEERLETVLPLVKKYGAAVIGISNDEAGISRDPDVRIAAARKIIQRAADHGIPASDIIIDPLVLPIGAVAEAGRACFETTRRVREELKVNTTCGASNVSFGLPLRGAINATFIAMLMQAGLTSAIVNPTHGETHQSIMAAEVLLGLDSKCKRWIKRARQMQPVPAKA